MAPFRRYTPPVREDGMTEDEYLEELDAYDEEEERRALQYEEDYYESKYATC